jgi:hypothetical protein
MNTQERVVQYAKNVYIELRELIIKKVVKTKIYEILLTTLNDIFSRLKC